MHKQYYTLQQHIHINYYSNKNYNNNNNKDDKQQSYNDMQKLAASLLLKEALSLVWSP